MNNAIIPVNHAARAWSMFVTAFGAFAEALQQYAPQVQVTMPSIKWAGPVVLFVGLAWATIQRIQDALKQKAAF